MKTFTKPNITALLIRIQNVGKVAANALATEAICEFGLEQEFAKQTGEPAPKVQPESAHGWTLTIDDGFCEYEYVLNARNENVSIYDIYELARQKLQADTTEGRCLDTLDTANRKH